MGSEISAREPDLRRQMEILSAELAASAPSEVVAALREATEDLLRSGIADRALHRGDRAPEFTLPDLMGRPFRLADQLSRGPLVVTFYRGAW